MWLWQEIEMIKLKLLQMLHFYIYIYINFIYILYRILILQYKKQLWPDSSSTRHSRELINEQYKKIVSDIYHAIKHIRYKQQILTLFHFVPSKHSIKHPVFITLRIDLVIRSPKHTNYTHKNTHSQSIS